MSRFLVCECCNQTYLEEDMSKNNKNMCCCCWCYTRPKDKRIAELEEQLKNAISFCHSMIDNINNRYPEGAVISEWFSREYCIYEEMLKKLQGENK